jgi:hypothetical protein
MNKPANGSAPESAVDRAEALLSRFGQRVRQARAEAEQKEAAAQAAAPDASALPARPASERADALLDRAGERLGRLASDVSQRVRKSAAFAREEAEDMVAEANHLRQNNRP